MEDPDGYWLAAAEAVEWDTAPTRALDDSNAPMYAGSRTPRSTRASTRLDRHVRDGRGDQAALIWDSAMVPAQRTYTYAELLAEVARFAGVLSEQGVVAATAS